MPSTAGLLRVSLTAATMLELPINKVDITVKAPVAGTKIALPKSKLL